MSTNSDTITETIVYGLLAFIYMKQGDKQRAYEAATTQAERAPTTPTVHSTVDGYAGVAYVYLATWETEQKTRHQGKSETAVLAQQALKPLQSYAAQTMPVSRPSAHLYQGWYEWLNGKHTKAHKTWQKGLVHAQKIYLPYEQASLHYQIGKHTYNQPAHRQHHLTQAMELFTSLKATQDIAQVKSTQMRSS